MKTGIKLTLLAVGCIFLLSPLFLAGCSKEADVASYNISQAADQFQIERRIVFYNSIQKEYLLSIEGRCAIDIRSSEKVLAVTCKTSETQYKKHYLGLSDNVTYFAEQLKEAPVNVYRYKVIFRPQTIVPDVDLAVGR
ncbi:MAG: hypothetical protein A4E63_01205 [Syntrophorhabdus sp. PtaU1.Bin050]|nr:MAG: hypothetical protein A4E63_01205 [Syntrophorhabdus sp. PtaU1.Bin050]